MKKAIKDFREAFDRAILRSLEAVQARALGYDYEEVWAMGVTCAQVGMREDEIRDVLIRGFRVDSPERKKGFTMNDKELIAEARKLLFSDSELGYEYTGGGGLIYRLADALEVALAARQSSGDTCGDDRETLDKVITEYDMALYTKEETLDRLASRAAVPDAATERELEAVKEHREKWMARAFSAEAERDAALAAIERVRSINTGNNRALYGNDFEAGMAKALWLVKAALDGAPEPGVKP